VLPVAIVLILEQVLNIYIWVIIAAAVISWVTPNPYNPVVRLLRRVTEPVLAPIRQLLPPWKTFGLDFSPMIIILLIQWALKPLLWTLAG
jgi:YggT family protein